MAAQQVRNRRRQHRRKNRVDIRPDLQFDDELVGYGRFTRTGRELLSRPQTMDGRKAEEQREKKITVVGHVLKPGGTSRQVNHGKTLREDFGVEAAIDEKPSRSVVEGQAAP